MISRLPGALVRAFLVVWLIATPNLLLPSGSADGTEIVALICMFAAVFTFIEYASAYPSLVEFRHAPPFNRVRFLSLFATVFMVTIILRGEHHQTAITELVTAVGSIVGHSIDFPYSPVRNVVLMLPEGTNAADIDIVRTASGISYFCSLISLAIFLIVIRLDRWPGRYGSFNVYINLPTFDPTAGGDVVERLQRDGRVNVALGFLLPFLIPAVVKVSADLFSPVSLDSPHTLIWMMTAWAFLPSSLFMRGIAMGRVAQMIEEQRRRRYAEVGEEDAVPA